jgi:hypothetical protein
MAVYRLDQGAQLAKSVGERVRAAADRGLLSAVTRLQEVIVTEIIPAEDPPPINTRAYATAWTDHPVKIAGGYMIKNSMPYAVIIDKGARAENIKVGRAMIDALTEWALMKGLAGRPRGQVQRAKATSVAAGIAWAIARSMQKKGIFNRGGEKGLRIAEKAAKLAPEIIREEVQREIAREFR